MTLIRVSDFCRSTLDEDQPSVIVRASTTADSDVSRIGWAHLAIGWVSVQVLVELSAKEGSLAWLSLEGKEESVAGRRVLLRLKLLEDCNVEEEEDTTKCYVPNGTLEIHDNIKIVVAPIILTNLGIRNLTAGQQVSCRLERTLKPPRPSSSVLLRPLGRMPDPFRIKPPTEENENDEERKDDDPHWIFPQIGSWVQASHLTSAYSARDNRVCYYEVIQITTDGTNDSMVVGEISASTKFSLESSPVHTGPVRRLPPLLSQYHHYAGMNIANREQSTIAPHPDLKALTKLFDLPSGIGPTGRILHVQGNAFEHDVCTAVDTAAKELGRTCWSIKGLAAQAHALGRTIRTGGLADQLLGLKAVLKEIVQKRMEPCLLHLYDIDEEWAGLAGQSAREDFQHRIWSKLEQALSMAHETSFKENLGTYPLIIVLSTRQPLESGPWLQNLVFPSKHLSLPDESYIRHIWIRGRHLSESALKLLLGRSAGEIRKIQQELLLNDDYDSASDNDDFAIEEICDQMDVQQRRGTSACVADVHWGDIGGLEHVRREIMDAIELPLQYPTMFRNNRGRSGILLYGPPGTGKTLVAKAVATECGLPFLSVKGPELLGSYVGESEKNVREVFQAARTAAETNKPSSAAILFFDELDSLAPRRGGVGGGAGVMERVVATLFAELDGNERGSGNIFVIGATNRPDLLDPNLLRPGRLERLVYLGVAVDPEARANILTAQLRKLKLQADPAAMSRRVVAALPDRLTGADFSTIASGALRLAVQRLCRHADGQVQDVKGKNDVTIAEVLEGWGEEACTPVIQLEDLLEAARQVQQSISANELERYERLRDHYQAKQATEIEGDIFY